MTTKNNRKFTYSWKLNNSVFNDNLVREEIKKEIKDFIKFNENENTSYPNLWDTMKAELRGKFKALSAFIQKSERSHISKLTAHLKALEQKEANTPKRSRLGKIFTNLTSDRGLISKIYKELKKSISKTPNNPIKKKQGTELNREFTTEGS
jgi:Rps23 Pro-64 3,4-dihydroxylase Tpa1-like proline 4-hydroxylase